MGGKILAFSGLLLIFGLFRSSLSQTTYLCNGQSYGYPYAGCTYGNTYSNTYGNTGLYGLGTYNNPYSYGGYNNYANSYYPYNNYNNGLYGYNNYGSGYNNYGSTGTQYLCNGVLTPYPNSQCTHRRSIGADRDAGALPVLTAVERTEPI